jgi:hypothetical protein
MLALFRLIDVNSGVVRLDGLDASTVGLDALRKQLAIIPQVGTRLPSPSHHGVLCASAGPWQLPPSLRLTLQDGMRSLAHCPGPARPRQCEAC